MRTGTSFAANSSARVKQEATSSTRDSTPHCWLWQDGFVQLPIANHIDGKLAFAVKAFEAQLKLNNIQSPQHKHAGLKELARKLRLEVRPGGDAWGQLGLLQGVATTVVQLLDDIARKRLQGLRRSLRLPAGAVSPLLDSMAVDSSKQSASSLEAIHYMLSEDALEACEAHEDKGLLTVIYADTKQGLQVQGTDGIWRELLLPRGHVAILAGHTLERATCGLIKAAKHKVVMGALGGCPTARNALVYKLRAPDTAVLDLYAALSKFHYVIPPRYQSPIGVHELMHVFHGTHTSVNALPAPAPKHELQPTVTSTKTAIPESQPPPAPSTNSSQGDQLKVRVNTADGASREFLILPTTPLRALFHAFSLWVGFSISDGEFIFQGEILKDHWTAEQYGLEHGDITHYICKLKGD